MSAFPRSAQVYIWSVILAAVWAVLLLSKSFNMPFDPAARLVLALLIVSNVLADLYHIHLHYKIEVTMSTATNFAALLVFGPAIAFVVGGVGSIGGDLVLRKPWYKILFNASNTVLSITITHVVYQHLNDGSVVPLSSAANAAALGISGLTYLVANTGLVCLVIALVERHRAWDVAKTNYRGVTFQLITLIPIGTLISIVYYQTPWGVILLLFPIVMTHYSFENFQRLRSESKTVLEMLADAVDERDKYTFEHSVRVGALVHRTARKFNLDLEDLTTTTFAARVHDLGKIGIDSSILLKKGKLEPWERAIIEKHPVIGAKILAPLSLYEGVRELIEHHHERADGTGYPDGIKGKDIPLGARIIGVADAFDAMTTDRPYRKALSVEEAIAELRREAGKQFDAEVVDKFLQALEEVEHIRRIPVEMDFQVVGKDV